MKKKSSVAVIGAGFVGGSLAQVLAEQGFTVYNYDITGKMAPGTVDWKTLGYGSGLHGLYVPKLADFVKKIEECDPNFNGIYFVCLPTPMDLGDGHADLSIVDGVLKELSQIPSVTTTQRVAVVKSTVPPGSTEAWNAELNPGLFVVFNPEFLTEANALDDMRHQTRIVIGGPRPHINRVKQFYQNAFPNVPLVKTSSTTAEMVKYFTNIQLAARVILSTELSNICSILDTQGLNIDYDKVLEYARLDKRLGDSHMAVPGNDGIAGARGHCVPDDTQITVVGDVLQQIAEDGISSFHRSVEDVTFSDLYNKFIAGDKIRVLSANVACNDLNIKDVKSVVRNEYEGVMYVLHYGEITFTSTPEHIMPIKRDGVHLLVCTKDVKLGDSLYKNDESGIVEVSVTNITTFNYSGFVFNLELISTSDGDDLFWVSGKNKVFSHNCFPKDLSALIFKSKSIGYEPKLLEALQKRNLDFVPPEHRDWEQMSGRAVSGRRKEDSDK